jgi:hypothetical protein
MNADPVADLLDVFTPPFDDARERWRDVVDRATTPARRRRRALSLAVSCAGAAAIALVVLWPLTSTPSVLARALVAVGGAPLTHIVIDDGTGTSLVDLRTGQRRPAPGRLDVWFDARQGVAIRGIFRGQVTRRAFIPAAQARRAGGFSGFVAGYREKLRRHEYRVTGSGTIGGRPVYWIESRPRWETDYPSNDVHKYVEQVAISKTTFKPVLQRTLRDGRVDGGSQFRVLVIETMPTRPALFRAVREAPSWDWTGTSPPLTSAEVRARTHDAALLPARVAGLPRTWQGEPPYLAGCCGSATIEAAGVSLYYGALDESTGRVANTGHPLYRGRYVSITEFPRPDKVAAVFGSTYFPAPGLAIVGARGITYVGRVATFRAHGVAVIVQASSDALALAAARVLSR